MKDHIGKQLKELRQKGGMSQEELAGLARVSLRTVQRFENAETTPRGDTVKRLFQIFGKSPEEVLDWSLEESKGFLSTMAISGLIFFLNPILGIIVPLIFWLNRRGKIVGVDETGRKLINFHLTMIIPYLLIRLISFLKLVPEWNNGEVSLDMDWFQQAIWINGIAFALVGVFAVWNAYRLYLGKSSFYPIAIPFIR